MNRRCAKAQSTIPKTGKAESEKSGWHTRQDRVGKVSMMYSRAGLNGFQLDIGTRIIPKQDVMTQKGRLKPSI